MAIEYKWTISAMDCVISEDGLSNVVKTIHWRYKATDGKFKAESYGTAQVGEPNPESFTDYDSLTEFDVIAWLEEILEVDKIQANLVAQIELLKNPISVTLPPPFAN